MTLTKLTTAFLIALTLFSCKEEKKTEIKTNEEVKTTTVNTDDTATVDGEKFQVDTKNSTIAWKGSKIVGDAHHGTLHLSEGSLYIKDGKLTGGSFVIDMNSIKNIDVTDASYNKKLVNHLLNEDFFDAAKYPTATFKITEVVYEVGMDLIKGDLSIKGITKNISVPATTTVTENGATFKSLAFEIDRTEWGIKYKSGKFFASLKDKAIKDEFEITVNLIANK